MPTGAGKTEGAVLGWLYRRRFATPGVQRTTPRRLVYCLPMRVLVEQTVERIRRQLVSAGVQDITVHQLMGGAVARDWWLRPEDEMILVGTLDQLVSRALLRGYGVSRYSWPIHFALLHNEALWVYDEVQLMGEALATSAQLDGFRAGFPSSCGPSGSVWMSATIEPRWIETVDRPAPTAVVTVSDEDRQGVLSTRLRARKTLRRLDVIDAASVVSAHVPGSLTLVVLNTVREAQTLERSLRKWKDLDTEVVLVHSRFRPVERATAVERLLAPITTSGPGRIVVSTQVIEAGVDLDARTLMTHAAPWASLVQRFGRCNRAGLLEKAEILWGPPKKSLPYDEADVVSAAEILTRLEGQSLSPETLEQLDAPLTRPPRRFVIRRRDFVGLFDTAPDISGLDLDIQRFVRDGDDLMVSIAWRALGVNGPLDGEPALGAAELSPAPIGEVREILKKSVKQAWRFDPLDDRWGKVGAFELRPGDRLLVDSSFGCYDIARGFTKDESSPVEPVVVHTVPEEGVDAELASVDRGAWLTIAEHTDGVCTELERLLATLGSLLTSEELSALRDAARWHDRGKAHPIFQETMRSGATELPEWATGEVALAKRVGQARHSRRGFRHELASLLAYLAGDAPDPLAAYLIGAHHGRVRLGARSLPTEGRPPEQERAFVLGCWQGEELPETDLGGGFVAPSCRLDLISLELGAEVGETYTDTALATLARLGPYRLAYLEALLRIADVRRSIAEEEGVA